MRTSIVALLLFCAAPVHAQKLWTAIAEFSVGEQYFHENDYPNALSSFAASYAAMPLPAVLYDLALVHYKLDNIYLAREYLRVYVRQTPRADQCDIRKLSDALASAVDEDLAALDQQGLTFACDLSTGLCGRGHWSDAVKRAWAKYR